MAAPGRPAVSPYSGAASALFPWTLAKAFLSSPAALLESIKERIGRLGKYHTAAQEREIEALLRLEALARKADDTNSGKYARLLSYLRQIGVGPNSPERVVIFAERVATLKWLREHLQADLKLTDKQAVVLHGGLTDAEQQDIVDSFKQVSSPIRVLVTGDLASEGVNLHAQCHELIHYDIPWSPDPDRAAQRPHRPLRAAEAAADHDAAAQPRRPRRSPVTCGCSAASSRRSTRRTPRSATSRR